MSDGFGIGGQVTPEFVPEPASLPALLGLSLLTAAALVRKRKWPTKRL
jgi:hypothetical protein